MGDKGAKRHGRGFRQAASLVGADLRAASEARGFAKSRLLTHWAEIAGPALAAKAQPVKISYGQGGMGGTLTLLTSGANAPMIEMESAALRERVNACYGYNAISRIRITQTSASGFAEGQAPFAPAPQPPTPVPPDPAVSARAAETTKSIADEGLRSALENLGRSILSRSKQTKGSP